MEPLYAREGDLDQPAVMDHPQAEAVVLLVMDQDLHTLRPGPRQRLQVPQQPGARAHPFELRGPSDAEGFAPLTRDRYEPTSPTALFVVPGEGLHDLRRVERQHDHLCESAHAEEYDRTPGSQAIGLPAAEAALRTADTDALLAAANVADAMGSWVRGSHALEAVAEALRSAGPD
ncbi:hypothetical protein [Actinoallomurus soli]|uniref:hypothetical protein n=1 Tax=Actinoallomurus soli TaxID=2952535 RepID=UPI0020935827|nr:hypothetical protein [Actinoallomurus soli]MCO5967768.1 hypothetical protein [Actinoallomurus soli]